jgi:hypothetical protein
MNNAKFTSPGRHTYLRIASLALAFLLTGCALAPNSVRPEFDHLSHLTQHEPFTSHPTNDGADIAFLLAHWDLKRAYLEIGEGYSLNHGSPEPGVGYGEIGGPREQFTARFGLIILVKP